MHVSLTRTIYLSIDADHVHPLKETVFPDGCGLCQQDDVPFHKAKLVQGRLEEHEVEVLTCFRTSVHLSICGMCWTNKSDPWKPHLTTEGSDANKLVPDTTAHLQGSSEGLSRSGQFWQQVWDQHNKVGGHKVVFDFCLLILLSNHKT